MEESTNLNRCFIELHYCFRDDVHYMDELIYNRCKIEFYAIVREVARGLGVKVKIRTEVSRRDGILCCLMIDSPGNLMEYLKIIIEILNLFCSIGFFIYTVHNDKNKSKSEKEIAEEKRDIAKIESETAKFEGETAKSKYETAKYDCMTKELYEKNCKKIEKRRSNFFANLFFSGDVVELNIRFTDANGAECLPEEKIKKDDFKMFIMPNNEVVPEYICDVEIKKITPIVKGRHKWMGVYNGERVFFSMRSNAFKKGARRGQIPIKKGTSIKCHLKIHRKIDIGEGMRIVGYEVTKVTEILD